MSWAPGRDAISGMLDCRELETITASMDLANALLAQAEEAIDTAIVVIRGHALVQNLRRGHYELGVEIASVFRLATAFDELQIAI